MTFEEWKEKHSDLIENVAITFFNYERGVDTKTCFDELEHLLERAFRAGRLQWHKVFEGNPYSYEYWDLPQNNLPKIENFYFVKLKNGFVKICELKYDHWSRKKYFYDLHGIKQSNVAEWLDYPTFTKE